MPPLASSLLSRSAAAGGPGPSRVTAAAAAAISKPAAAEAGPSPSPSTSAPHHPLPARGQAPRRASASSPFASGLVGRLFGGHRAAARSSSSVTAVFERRFASAATKNAYDEILTSLTKPGGGADFGLRTRLADFGLARVESDPDPDDKLESGMIAEGADANENGLDGVCDDDVSVVDESTVTTTVDGEGNVVPKSPEDDEGGFTLASPTEAASTSGFDQTSVDSGMNGRSCNGVG